ncbi:pyridoxamine 5'-phosphate oxidase family protein [Tessaracoccus rhinocerotis]|uniref:Pyridoxamine 5'-phosphate oxidase family protein n=1 Tax=Tessaracoccus rhinocerotis TaxID=1689449 RepID=A0A553JXE7_9ACTN|nr:pyridoxamine 5'-phosphate oxidase family protein [Tessaracoccus rhinocerotis]TRY17125.1 pyridoxamine 5'-phosphate oxidase family protein [Tessaracoccus rhinocerotis]
MAQQFSEIIDRLQKFIEAQHIYFVATAASTGRVNVSPKGLDSLRVLGPNRVVWLNGTGSGNETAAHILETNRMTIMFCSFETKPLILRLYGTAKAIHVGEPGWDELLPLFPPMKGSRNIFDVEVDLVQTSCGFGVPFMDFVEDRDTMDKWSQKKGEGVVDYQQANNHFSIDGFPTGLPVV